MLDPYLYEDCSVLRNKLGLKVAEVLELAEVEFSCNAIQDLVVNPIPGRYDFAHLCQFHGHIFGDVYDWAGSPRTVPMEKQEAILGYASIIYAHPTSIETEATAVLNTLNAIDWASLARDERARELSAGLAALWKVHPFREGNTRTTITFLCQFADEKGLNLKTPIAVR
jgi:cell filamentation protein